jgi:23S rRNA pseudouridine2605 synthase
MPNPIRINKLISKLGIASRRKADEMIEHGRVHIGTDILAKPGAMVDIEKDVIFIDGKKIDLENIGGREYVLLNKPAGYITTVRDTHQRRTVMDLVPKQKALFPVGRLDKDTTGALILTNDGELAHRLMHPSFEMEKIYEVVVAGSIKRADITRIETGVNIGDPKKSCLKIVNSTSLKGETALTVCLHEGRKRQIRRTFIALGYKIKTLKRTVYAGIEVDVDEGSWRSLTEGEIAKLKKTANLK